MLGTRARHGPRRAARIALAGVFAEIALRAEAPGRDRNVFARGLDRACDALVAKAGAVAIAQPVSHLVVQGDLMDGLGGFSTHPLCQTLPCFGGGKARLPQMIRTSGGELARLHRHDGPLTAIPGVVFSGGWDGVVRALAAADGHVIWEYNTVHDYETSNGVAGKGGSIGAAGPIVAGGTLFVPSGYVGVNNGMPGNVLLAFTAGGN